MNVNEDPTSLFEMVEHAAQAAPEARALMMTDNQRAEIRSLFARLGVSDAATQFDVTEQLTGTRIAAVGELDASAAHRLVSGLRRRVAEAGLARTGNAWDDREEDTWIDRL